MAFFQRWMYVFPDNLCNKLLPLLTDRGSCAAAEKRRGRGCKEGDGYREGETEIASRTWEKIGTIPPSRYIEDARRSETRWFEAMMDFLRMGHRFCERV
jgi:hypothetical protein